MRRLPRPARIALRVAVSGAVIAYLVWQIDVGRTVDLVGSSNGLALAGALALFLATTWGMAWRWQLLLAARGIRERLGFLTGLYFVGYAAGQVLPTSIGGDAVRIVEHGRKHPGRRGEVAAAILLERVIGSAGTLVMVAVGLAVAAGRFQGIGYLVWIEAASVVLVAAGFFLMFSTRARARLGFLRPFAARLRVEGPASSVYEGLHGYRDHPRALSAVLGVTVVLQAARIAAIWLCGEAVGVDVSPLVYVILGPLLFGCRRSLTAPPWSEKEEAPSERHARTSPPRSPRPSP